MSTPVPRIIDLSTAWVLDILLENGPDHSCSVVDYLTRKWIAVPLLSKLPVCVTIWDMDLSRMLGNSPFSRALAFATGLHSFFLMLCPPDDSQVPRENEFDAGGVHL